MHVRVCVCLISQYDCYSNAITIILCCVLLCVYIPWLCPTMRQVPACLRTRAMCQSTMMWLKNKSLSKASLAELANCNPCGNYSMGNFVFKFSLIEI